MKKFLFWWICSLAVEKIIDDGENYIENFSAREVTSFSEILLIGFAVNFPILSKMLNLSSKDI